MLLIKSKIDEDYLIFLTSSLSFVTTISGFTHTHSILCNLASWQSRLQGTNKNCTATFPRATHTLEKEEY